MESSDAVLQNVRITPDDERSSRPHPCGVKPPALLVFGHLIDQGINTRKVLMHHIFFGPHVQVIELLYKTIQVNSSHISPALARGYTCLHVAANIERIGR